MKVSSFIPRAGLAMIAALALAGAAAPVRAEGGPSPSFAMVEGLVVQASDVPAGGQGTMLIHPAFGSDVTLKIDANTHFRKAGGKLDTPDELSDNRALPAVQNPSPTWFVGLFARAYYDKASFLASQVALSSPEPLLVNGVVAGSSQTSLDLNDPKRGSIHLTLNGDTLFRKNGLLTDPSGFQAGDLVEALFWLLPDHSEALRVNGHSAPPQHFEGALIGLLMKPDGTVGGFDVTRGTVKMSFTDDQNTTVKVDGKPGSLADLKVGQFVSVYYQAQGGANLALGVLATNPKPKSTETHHDSQGGTNTGDSGKPKPPTPKPTVAKPQVVAGVVSALCDGSVFQITKADGSPVTFGVDAKTVFRMNDKAAACSDLALGQHVSVVFVPADKPVAMYVLIHAAAGSTQEHGSGGGAGTPEQ